MSEGCVGCIEKLKDVKKEKIQEEALALANKTGEWVAIVEGDQPYVLLNIARAGGYFIREIVSPKLHNLTI